MCGACQEFAPTWAALAAKTKHVATGKINIDKAEGSDLAEKLGVLDEGLPNIRLFGGSPSGVSIFKGDGEGTVTAILAKIRQNLTRLTKRDDGYFVK
jgi:thiol-disulfide isomerase/thioredoxin